MRVKCPTCNSERFYLSRTYKGREHYDINKIERDGSDGPVYVDIDASQARSDEYMDILEETIHCSECERILAAPYERLDGSLRGWAEMSFELEWN
jgi:phage FluMu protein Com